jgi:hypothetical protein
MARRAKGVWSLMKPPSLTLAIRLHIESLKFSVTKLRGRSMILGILWLK